MVWLDSITDSMAMNLSKFQEILKDREDWHAAVHGVTKSQTWLSNWTIISIKATHSFSEHKLIKPQLNTQIKKWARITYFLFSEA